MTMTDTPDGGGGAAATAEPPVLTRRDGGTLVIQINRPAALNAIDAATAQLAGEAMASAQSDPDVRVVVLTGTGPRAFSAGADLKALTTGKLPYADRTEWGFAGIAEHAIDKPVIAAVNGLAFGGGLEIVATADLVIAAEHARFAIPEVRVGVIAGAGGLIRLPRQIPYRAALAAGLTGEPFTAQQALAWGFVNEVVAADDVLPRALELAGRIGENAPLAVQASKRIMRGIVDGVLTDEDAAWDLSNREMLAIRETADFQEGPRAFAEKRQPRWQGR
jgi:crotonobetainyl-CoA hydratase